MARTLADNIMGTGIDAATANEIANAIGGSLQPGSVGQPGGPAGPLSDPAGTIPLNQMPIDGLNFKGAWDASTNTPTLADGVGTAGDFYRVSTAGSQDLGSGAINFAENDHVIYEGGIWQSFSGADSVLVGGNTTAGPLEFGTSGDQPVHIQTRGDNRIVITDIGNVGIAIENPTAPLHVGGGMFIEAGSVVFQNDLSTGTVTTLGNFSNHNLDITTNNITRLTVGSNGQLVAASGYTPTDAKSLAPKDYVDGAVFSGAYGDLSGAPITVTSGTVQLELNGEELSWPTDVQTGKIRLYNSTPESDNTFYGLGVQNGVQVYQVDSNTSKHVFQGVDGSDNATTIAELSHDGGIVSHVDTKVASADPQFEIHRTGASANEGRWNWSTDPDQLSLTAVSDDGNTVGTAWLLTRSGANITAHSIQAAGNALLELSAASDIIAFVDLHMSEQKIVNMGDPTNARDGVNLQTLDGRLSAAQRTAIDALTTGSGATVDDIISALQAT